LPRATEEEAAPFNLAPLAIIDAVAVADAQSFLSAESPDRVLYEAGEVTWERFVEFFRVYANSDLLDNFRAAIFVVATRTVWMLGVAPHKNSRPMKEFVHQRVDGDHAATGFVPMRSGVRRSEQNHRECHAEHFVGNAIDVT
jgi:hypothetical protein